MIDPCDLSDMSSPFSWYRTCAFNISVRLKPAGHGAVVAAETTLTHEDGEFQGPIWMHPT